MTEKHSGAAAVLGLAAGYGVLAYASLAFTLEANHPAAVWPANALTVVFLLRSRMRHWPVLLFAAWLGGTVAGLLSGFHMLMAPPLAVFNGLESFICAWTLRRDRRGFDLTRPVILARFSMTALMIAPVPSAIGAALIRAVLFNSSFFENALIWWAAHAVGLLIFTPALLTIAGGDARELANRAKLLRTVLCFLGLGATWASVFLQSRYPLLFIIPPVLGFVTVQLGLSGAVWGLLGTSVFAIVASLAGHGPSALIQGSMTEHILVVQAFLVFLTGSILPFASMLAERNRLQVDVVASRDKAKAAVASLSEINRKAAMAEQMAGVGYWHVDLKTNVPSWSEHIYRIYGLDPAAGPPSFDQAMAAFHSDDRQMVADIVAEAVATGQCYALEARLMRGNEERIVLARAECETNEAGDVVAILGTFMDVTETKRAQTALRDSEERFRTLAENSSDMLMRLSLSGEFVYISPAVEKIAGFKPHELIGKSSLELVDTRDIGLINTAILAALRSPDKRAPHTIVYRGTRKGGGEIWMESRPYVVVDPKSGQITAITDVARDVTERVELEVALRAAKTAAEAASVAKSDFLSNMSHELRTPLTAIVGFSELLKDSGGLSPREQHFAERIDTASQALRGLVSDILDYSKIEAGMIDFEFSDVDADEIVFSCLSILSVQAEKKGLALSADLPPNLPPMRVDQTRLRQIVLNLLSNAVKFTAHGSVVVSATAVSNGMLRLSVKDTGPGVDPADAERLFERFTQADSSTTRRHGGTGLGLAICKGLTEGMGGRIGVDSELRKGATFWVELPIAERRLTMAAA